MFVKCKYFKFFLKLNILDFRWVLSGTPIQNKILDMYSLIKFLNVENLKHFKIWKYYFPSTELNSNQLKLNPALDKLSMKRAKIIAEILVLRRLKTDIVDGKPLVIIILGYFNINRLLCRLKRIDYIV